MIRVLVVDDHPIVSSGVAGLLATEADFEVIGEAESGEAALATLHETTVDVVLMDLRMPGMGGVEATRQIVHGDVDRGSPPGSAPDSPHHPDRPVPRVLVFTTYEDDDQILAAIEAGASGYLVKAAPAAELAAGVRAVAAGQMVLAPSVAAQIVARAVAGSAGRSDPPVKTDPPRQADPPQDAATPQDAAPNTRTRLTQRETEIICLVREGHSNPEIAQRLHIGESTVKTHLLHVFEKLEVSDRTRAVIRAMELGLID